jgi:hypothetical protein
MKNFLLCRRTFISTLALASLTALGCYKGMDVTMAVASVAVGLAAANAYEGSNKSYKG